MSRTAANLLRHSLRVVVGDETAATGTARPTNSPDRCVRVLPGDDAVAIRPARWEAIDDVTSGSARLQRLFDVVAAALLLMACAPLLLLIAALSKLSQPGPLLYCQERIGRHGQPFQMLKFRSMRVDAERHTGPVFSLGKDPRCTRLGAMLRRSCCDELPQLINVIRGEMSLVGPRPERPFFVEQFRRCIPRYDERHSVRPGITGWAQVNGWRGDTRFEERLQFDLEYVRRSSLLFDLQILIRTPWTILRPKRINMPVDRAAQFDAAAGATGSRTDELRFDSAVRRAA